MARRVAKGYKAAEKLPQGLVLQAGVGSSVKKWVIGPSVGAGGFGDIYSAREENSSDKTYPFVVKVEPHGNGPLFVEMHFYMRNAKKADIEDFVKSNKLKTIGMPVYIASGSLEYNKEKYRFIVMERFGKDLWSKFLDNSRIIPTHIVFRIAIQMLDVYNYIHSRTYIHGDLKGANILFGLKKGLENQLFLVDFGLATHYSIKEYKRDPKRCHDGTIEYTSRDAHNGVPTRRGDMEILAYNIVQWLTGSLPWENDLKHPVNVQTQKEKCMSDIPSFLKKTFTKVSPPAAVMSYLQYVAKMEHDEVPDYKSCRQMFESGLKSLGYSVSCNLDFTPTRSISTVKGKNSLNIGDQAVKKVVKRTRKQISKKTLNNKSDENISIDSKMTTRSNSFQSSQGNVSNVLNNSSATVNESLNCEILNSFDNTMSSVDIFEDSCIETPPKRGKKRKYTKKFNIQYCTDDEVTVCTTVKKKDGKIKEEVRSWKKCPTILNGKPAIIKNPVDLKQ